MNLTEKQIESLSVNPAAFKSGQKLSSASLWETFGKTERAVWGKIKGSGKNPYLTQIDLEDIAYKCSCPSRQFPCKHALALLLLISKEGKSIKNNDTEPEWVKEWLEKRRKKSEPKEEIELSEEETEKREQQKEKRFEDRVKLVDSGVKELEKWLHDIVKVGLLELPNKPPEDYKKLAARMVDAQCVGLAAWIRSLGNIDFSVPDVWQKESMHIIGKIHLLTQAWNNLTSFDNDMQMTVRNLIGWSQSSKDLMSDKDAKAIKDQWLILGEETEDLEDLSVQRFWLFGCHSGKAALILNFATQYSSFENKLIPGTIIEAELAFFKGSHYQRAIVRFQKRILEKIEKYPEMPETFEKFLEIHTTDLCLNPWLNNQAYLIKDVRITKFNDNWYLSDNENKLILILKNLNEDRMMKWLLFSGNEKADAAFVLKGKNIMPLGLFIHNQYILL